MRDAGRRTQNKMRIEKRYKIEGSGCRMQDAGCRIQVAE